MIPMPPENIRRISVFGLGHRFLPGTRNSHFSRPVTSTAPYPLQRLSDARHMAIFRRLLHFPAVFLFR